MTSNFFKRPPCLAHSNGHFAPDLGTFGDRHFHSNRLHEIQAGLRDFHRRSHTSLILIAFNHPTMGAILWSPTKINQLLSFCCLVGAVHVEIAWVLFKPKPCCLRRQFAPHRHELWPATLRRWGMRKTTQATLKRERWSSGSIESLEYMSLSL